MTDPIKPSEPLYSPVPTTTPFDAGDEATSATETAPPPSPAGGAGILVADQQLAALAGHGWAVAFNVDGSLLATGGDDNAITLWDAGGQELARLTGHRNWVVGLAFSPHGKTLASAGWDNRAGLWDVSDARAPRNLTMLEGHTKSVFSVAFSPSGNQLATAGADGKIILWDVSDAAAPAPIGQPIAASAKGHANGLAFSRDGRLLAAGACADPREQPGLGYSCAEGELRVWNVSDPAAPQPFGEPARGGSNEILSLAFSRDNALLASTDGRRVALWEVESGGVVSPPFYYGPDTGAQAVSFSPTAALLAYTGCATPGENRKCLWGEVGLWDLSAPTAPRLLAAERGHSNWIPAVAFSPDGRRLASVGWDGALIMWDVAP